ncbi:DeoR/GlpR family DNA-binding transcription regulator [Salipaludibacillus sp. HK11]|uniref:DeoR/GlpR family DNA-binding transcription regulator n=1 Tax=Salipaludibacillus sp. HK11 TaxID=3394320 RepID=UPI0039FB8F53
MLSVERHEKILNELDKQTIVKVSYLSHLLQVTDKTIRIDLETLENRGLLKRIHGGATILEEENSILPIKKRQLQHSDVKDAIAREALLTIKENDTLLIDGGSSTLALAHLLGDFPISVITNDIKLAYELLNKEKVQLMMVGGTRIGTSGSLFGAEASDLLDRIRVNKIFFGTTGISIENGLTVLNGIHADWKRKALTCSNHVTLLADSSKFQKDALIKFASIEDLNQVITDDQIDKESYNKINERGVKVTRVSL